MTKRPTRMWRGDLVLTQFDDEFENSGDINNRVEAAYKAVVARQQETVAWYQRDKAGRRLLSKALRVASVTLVSGGVLVPLTPTPVVPNAYQWGYTLFAIAGALFAFDRLFGVSSAWMRDAIAIASLEADLSSISLEWTAAELTHREADAMLRRLEIIQEFERRRSQVVLEETSAWVTEFQGALGRLEALVRQGTGA